MAATLANRGVNPLSGERVVSEPAVRQVLSVMSTCGMYDAAGDWATQVGHPGEERRGRWSHRRASRARSASRRSRRGWTRHGTSVRGVSLFERFSSDMGLHVMEVAARRTRRRTFQPCRRHRHRAIRVLQLQGGIRFAGAERVVREAVALPDADTRVALDLTMVHSIDDVARRMLLEAVRRLTLDGHAVYVIDPDSVLPGLDEGDRPGIVVVGDLDDVVRAVADEQKERSVSGDRASSRA